MQPGEDIGIKLVWGLNIVWTATVALIFLTPYLASIDSPFAGYLYILFKPTCHQLASRSIFLWGHQMAVCARCTGIWLSLMLFGYAAAILLHIKRIPPLKLVLFLAALIPLALDGASQLVGLRESSDALRLVTATIAGAAIVWFVYPRLWIAGRMPEK